MSELSEAIEALGAWDTAYKPKSTDYYNASLPGALEMNNRIHNAWYENPTRQRLQKTVDRLLEIAEDKKLDEDFDEISNSQI